jgi:hypothetical protein
MPVEDRITSLENRINLMSPQDVAYTLGSGWSGYGPAWSAARATRIRNMVLFQGMVTGNGSAAVILRIAAEHAPRKATMFNVATSSGQRNISMNATATPGELNMDPGGAYAWVSLNGVYYFVD